MKFLSLSRSIVSKNEALNFHRYTLNDRKKKTNVNSFPIKSQHLIEFWWEAVNILLENDEVIG